MTCSAEDCEAPGEAILEMKYVGVKWRTVVCEKHRREVMKTMEGK